MTGSGRFWLAGMWPARYSSGERTSSRIAPGVRLHCSTPRSIGEFKRKKLAIGTNIPPYKSSKIAFLGRAPSALRTTLPPSKTSSVGIERMPYCAASSGCSSTLILPTLMSGRSSAICSTSGTTILHGPHHGAQKSSKTGTLDCFTSVSKFARVILITAICLTPFFRLGYIISKNNEFFYRYSESLRKALSAAEIPPSSSISPHSTA